MLLIHSPLSTRVENKKGREMVIEKVEHGV
jgi:hypothetical protein